MQGWIGSNVDLNRYAGWEVCEGAGVVGPGGEGVDVDAHWNLLRNAKLHAVPVVTPPA